MEEIRNGEKHPLQNIDTLECILKNLKGPDLLTCRQVCRIWRDCSAEFLRSHIQVLITTHKGSQKTLQNFVELVESKESSFLQFPFASHFELECDSVDNPRFWNTCGKYIKNLRLEKTEFPTAASFEKEIFQSCPNLKKLYLEYCEIDGEFVEEHVEWKEPKFLPNKNLKTLKMSLVGVNFSVGWMQMLTHFPSLKVLDVTPDPKQDAELFKSLELIWARDKNCCNLKKITFHFNEWSSLSPLSAASVLTTGNTNLSLESLSIGIYAPNATEPVQKIIASHATSLRKLSLYTSDTFESQIFPLPRGQTLEKLQVLSLLDCFVINSMNFLRYVPNIKELNLQIENFSKCKNDIDFVLTSCTELCVYCSVGRIMSEDVEMLAKVLPNIRKLTIDTAYNDVFAKICKLWPKLEFLYMTECCVDDSGISGLDVEDVERINGDGESGIWRPITMRRPNLSTLKNLREFSCTFRWTIVPGYCAAIYGVMKLPKLNKLSMKPSLQGTQWQLEDFWIPIVDAQKL